MSEEGLDGVGLLEGAGFSEEPAMSELPSSGTREELSEISSFEEPAERSGFLMVSAGSSPFAKKAKTAPAISKISRIATII